MKLDDLQKAIEHVYIPKEFHFTNEQIDQLLRLVRAKAFQVKYNPQPEDEDYDYNELADLIEDQIVNHPTNS